MSDERFTSYYERGNEVVIEDNGKRLSNKQLVNLLNEQQELIEELQASDEMGWKRAEKFEKKLEKELKQKKIYIKRLEYKVQKFKEMNGEQQTAITKLKELNDSKGKRIISLIRTNKTLKEKNKQLKQEIQGMSELLQSYQKTIKHNAELLANASKNGYLPPLDDYVSADGWSCGYCKHFHSGVRDRCDKGNNWVLNDGYCQDFEDSRTVALKVREKSGPFKFNKNCAKTYEIRSVSPNGVVRVGKKNSKVSWQMKDVREISQELPSFEDFNHETFMQMRNKFHKFDKDVLGRIIYNIYIGTFEEYI